MSYEVMPAPLDVLAKTLEAFMLVISITEIGVLVLIAGCFAIVAGGAIVNPRETTARLNSIKEIVRR